MHRAARRDDNEAPIVEALRDAGAVVYRLDERDLPDLLCGFRRVWYLLEVKGLAGPRGGTKHRHRDLRPGQAAFMESARSRDLPAAVVRSPWEALQAIGAIPAGMGEP